MSVEHLLQSSLVYASGETADVEIVSGVANRAASGKDAKMKGNGIVSFNPQHGSVDGRKVK